MLVVAVLSLPSSEPLEAAGQQLFAGLVLLRVVSTVLLFFFFFLMSEMTSWRQYFYLQTPTQEGCLIQLWNRRLLETPSSFISFMKSLFHPGLEQACKAFAISDD